MYHLFRVETALLCFQTIPRVQVDVTGAVAVTVAAFAANIFESWLGATAQGRLPWLSNDLVNVLQISLAAALAMGLALALGP